MFGPYSVHKERPNSSVEEESLTCVWKNGVLTITYIRHETPSADGPFYLAEWKVECPEPKMTREQRHRSANLLNDIDGLTGGPQS